MIPLKIGLLSIWKKIEGLRKIALFEIVAIYIQSLITKFLRGNMASTKEMIERFKKEAPLETALPYRFSNGFLLTEITGQCKSCKKEFTESTIFKHIIHKKSCKVAYSNEEIQLYHQWSKQRKNNKHIEGNSIIEL